MNSITDYRAETTTSKVLQALFIELIYEAKSHIPAVLTQDDDEELHQYRVALRKMHSILNEFRRCMDKDIYTLLKYELKSMISPTNELRDLDVFLANMDDYRKMLRPKQQKSLTGLESRLKQERNKDFEEVKQFVKSSEYLGMLSVINDLTKEDKFYSTCSQNAIDTVLRNLILKRYEAIRSEAKKLNQKSEPDAFHALRLSVKKQRYLIETFAHLFHPGPYAKVSKRLKSFQTRLGHLQDIHIQTDRIIDGMEKEKGAELLLSVLKSERKKCLRKVFNAIGKFCDKRFYAQVDALL